MENNNTGRPCPKVPDHELLRRIGRGGYGEVWLARNLFGIYRAVKVVYHNRTDDNHLFERELAGLYKFEPISRSHEGFVDVLHIGRDDEAGYFYYVMELADDQQNGQNIDPERYVPKTLGRNARTEPRLPIEQCLKLALSLSGALSQLHKANLVHRDIKPTNIIVLNGLPKLADIGLVAEIKEAHSFVGTEGYVPQEGPGSRQADVFSLGKVLYEISTGEDRRAFPRIPKGCDNAAFLELNEVIVKACHNDVHQRYQTADEMYADLAVLVNGKSVRRLRLLERRLAWLTRASAAAAIILVVAGLVYFQVERERKHRAELRQREVGSLIARGSEALDQGQVLQALPPFVEAFRLESHRRETLHRTRIGMLLQQCPRLLQMWPNSDHVYDGQFSRDGRFLALASETNGVQVMNVETGEPVSPTFSPMSGPPNRVSGVCFGPGGTLVVAANGTNAATVWDWRTGTLTMRLADTNSVYAATLNSSGTRIVTACADGVARVWDASSGTLLLKLKRHTGVVAYAAFSPDDKLIASAGRDNFVFIWNAEDGKLLDRGLRHKGWLYQVAFSPDGTHLATACGDNAAHVWNLNTATEICLPLKHGDVVESVEFSPDGQLILTGCLDSTARLWDATTGAPLGLNPVLRHNHRVLHAGFHPDGHRLVTTSLNGTSRLWDLAGAVSTPIQRQGLFSPDGSRFLIQSNAFLRVRQTKGDKLFPAIELRSPPKDVMWNRNGRFLLSLCPTAETATKGTHELAIWESETARQVYSLASFNAQLNHVALSDDGEQMVCFWTNYAKLYDLRTHDAPLPLPQTRRIIHSAAFSPSSQDLLGLGQNDVWVWNVNTRKLRFNHSLPIPIQAARFNSSGKLVAAYCADTSLKECSAQVWQTSDGTAIGAPLRHRDGVLSLAFSPKDDRVVTASEDSTALIWDRTKSREPSELRHRSRVNEACFNPDGSWVLTVSADTTARLWDTETGEPISPPLPHSTNRLQHGVFLDDHSFLTLDDKTHNWIWDVKRDSRPVEDLMLLAELLNGKRPPLNGPAEVEDTACAVWRKMKAKYPEDFTTTHDQLVAWHWQQAGFALAKDQLPAAIFHYDHLLGLQPGDQSIIRLRAEALQELKKTAAESR